MYAMHVRIKALLGLAGHGCVRLAPALREMMRAVVLQIVHTLVVDVTGVNLLQPFTALFHTILNIPQPQKAISSTKPTKTAADTKKTK